MYLKSGALGQSLARIHELSDRPYVERMVDKADFAYAWENIILPPILEILDEYEKMPFSIGVHNFPDISTNPVPRVIYITLPAKTPLGVQKLLVTNFIAVFRRRSSTRQVRGSVWHCNARHFGRSGGLEGGCDSRRFVEIGGDLYGMTSRRVIGSVMQDGGLGIVHPAESNHQANQSNGLPCRQKTLGDILCGALTYDNRPSLTFDGVVSRSQTKTNRVTMNWCLFGPVREDKCSNTLHDLNFNLKVTVGGPVMMQGNMEVHAVARTRGQSLGLTSDVPGLQRIDGHYRREWTVRNHDPAACPNHTLRRPSSQSVEAWVPSGVGVSGDSGAWLMRKPDSVLIGLVWGGDQNYGQIAGHVRFTYVTPIMDVFADIEEMIGFDVSLPTYREQQSVLDAGKRSEQWSVDRPHDLGLLAPEQKDIQSELRDDGVLNKPETPIYAPLSLDDDTQTAQVSHAWPSADVSVGKAFDTETANPPSGPISSEEGEPLQEDALFPEIASRTTEPSLVLRSPTGRG
ncbi:hypothetical protein GE09DRAFT_1188577 [Coniochaeta sp. 2T2.1]|nr:hypothetical protein GE09DRAFT_1188577 [Coniochaeta sp. 2T2.1]